MSLEIRELIAPRHEKSFTVGNRNATASLSDLPDVHGALLGDDARVTATLATINPNGRPQLTPAWFSHDGEFINLNSARGRLKDRNLRARPVASLMLMNPGNPYHFMTIEGVVEVIIDEDDPEKGHFAPLNADAHSQKYLQRLPTHFGIRMARCGSSTSSGRRRS